MGTFRRCAAERERIVGLLEEREKWAEHQYEAYGVDVPSHRELRATIREIKGE